MYGDHSNLLPMCSAARKKRLNSDTSPQRRIKLVQTADFKRVACKYGGPSRKAYFRLAFLYARHRRQSCDTAIKINPPFDGRSPLEKAAFIAVEVKNRTKRHQQPQSVYMATANFAESRTDPFYQSILLHMQKKRCFNTIKSATDNRFHV